MKKNFSIRRKEKNLEEKISQLKEVINKARAILTPTE